MIIDPIDLGPAGDQAERRTRSLSQTFTGQHFTATDAEVEFDDGG
ncbi:hypothetical protein [Microlunatus sp. GCM10028923]